MINNTTPSSSNFKLNKIVTNGAPYFRSSSTICFRTPDAFITLSSWLKRGRLGLLFFHTQKKTEKKETRNDLRFVIHSFIWTLNIWFLKWFSAPLAHLEANLRDFTKICEFKSFFELSSSSATYFNSEWCLKYIVYQYKIGFEVKPWETLFFKTYFKKIQFVETSLSFWLSQILTAFKNYLVCNT